MQQIDIHPKVLLEDDSLSEKAQQAYCLANSMIPELNDFLDKKEELQSKVADPKEKIEDLKEQIHDKKEQKESEEKSLEQIHSELEDKKDRLRFVLHEPSRTPILKSLWFLFNGKSWRKKYNSIKEDVNSEKLNYLYHKNEILMLEEVIDELQNKLEQEEAKLDELSHGIEDLPEVPKVLTAVGEINLSFFPIKISQNGKEDSKTEFGIIDLLSPNKQLELPQLDIDTNTLQKQSKNLELAQREKILISPNDNEKEKWGRNWDRLIGEERNYYNAIQKLQNILRNFRTEQVSLPLMENGNPLKPLLQTAFKNLDQYSSEKLKRDVQKNYRAIKNEKDKVSTFLSKDLPQLKILTQQIDENKLSKDNNQLSQERQKSSDYLLSSLNDIAYHSSLVANNYYCPKCNLQNDYFNEKINLDLKNIGDLKTLPTEELKDNIYEYFENEVFSESNNNIDEQKETELRQFWESTFDQLLNLEQEIIGINDKIDKAEFELQQLSLKRKQKNKIKLYIKIVSLMLKNPASIFQVKDIEIESDCNFSLDRLKNLPDKPETNSKLQYKVDNKKWNCPRCGSEFTHKEACYGAENKLKQELKTPALNQLWESEQTQSEIEKLEKNLKSNIKSIIKDETEIVQNNIQEFIDISNNLKEDMQEKRNKFSENIKKIKDRLTEIMASQEGTIENVDKITQHLKDELEKVPEEIENIEESKEIFSEVPDYIEPKTKYIYSQKFDNAAQELKLSEQKEE